MNELKIYSPKTANDFAAVRSIFSEYLTYLFSLPNMEQYIDPLQSPFDELDELQTGKYAPPEGTILLAIYENKPIGAVALRKYKDNTCEMKRLFVRPILRGASVGRKLAQAIIEQGRALGYESMLLDTHATMKNAHQLYESLGFSYISRYNDNPVPDALFMELKLFTP
jgi:GNAT superfamily N-acetyltransferase